MKRAIFWSVVISVFGSSLLAQEPSPSYAKNIRPFLAKYCLECHNSKALKGGLDLETHKAILEGGDKGAVLALGKPDDSRLVAMLEGKRKPVMPPKTAKFHPKADEIAMVRAWIKAGAKDDSADIKIVIPNIPPRKSAPPPVTALAYHPQGLTLFAAKHQRITRIDPRDGYELDSHAEPAPVTTLVFSPKGDHWVAAFGKAGMPSSAHLYQFANPYQAPKVFADLHQDAILALAFSPDSKTLASASYDTQIKLTPLVEDGRKQMTLKEHSDAVYGLTFSPDGKLLASCAADRAVKVWDAAAGKLLYTFDEATDWLYALAWSSDGKRLASGGVDKSIRVYEATHESGRLLHSVFAHEAPIQKLAFSRNGKTLFSMGQDRVIKSWDAERMIERRVFEPQPETMLTFAVHPERPQLALGRYDGAVMLVDAETGKLQAEVKGREQAPAKPQPPQVQKFGPSAGPRGGKIILIFEGNHLDTVDSVAIDKPGLSAEILHKTKARDKLEVALNLPAATPPGQYTLRLKNAAGESAPQPFIVDLFTAVAEAGDNNSALAGAMIKLPSTVTGSLDRAGDVDFFRFETAKGQELGVQVVTAAVGSKVEPYLQLTGPRGQILAESHDGFLGHKFEQAGVYALAVRDREFRGGPGMHYRLHLGEIPIVTSVFPLGVQRGTSAVIRFRGVFLDHDKFAATIGPAHGIGERVTVFHDTPLGKPLGNSSVVVGEYQDVFVKRDSKGQDFDGAIPVPGTANGELSSPGMSHSWRFAAKKGQRLVLEVEARRLGAQLDSVLDILDENNQPVPRAVLRCQARTFVTFRDHDSAAPGLRIEAWGELAVNDYIYVGNELLKIFDLPTHPDADCVFFNNNGRLGFLDTTPTHVSQNLPMYKVTIHPPGTKFPPNGYPVFTLNYRNDDGGPGHGRDSRILFDPPADGTYRAKIADTRGQGGINYGYRLTVRPPRPSFNVRFNPTSPVVPKGEAIPITVSCDRLDGYDGPIDLELAGLPAGFSAPKTAILRNEYSTAFALFADPKASNPGKAAPWKLLAQAAIDGKKVIKEVTGETPRVADTGEIVATTEQSEIAIKPGSQAKFTVHIERRLGFTGRIPLEVKGLPHGVKVLDLGLNGILITEAETRRTITLYAHPWVEPTNHPIVVLAKREGKNSEHAAKSVLLKVAR